MIQILLEEDPAAADLAAIENGLIEHAAQAGVENRNHQTLTVLARDESQALVGGLVGETVWGWLHVTRLWVAPEHRGKRYGTSLLQTAEREAERRGCHHACLDTFDFQAREFYERLGYATFGALDDFPRGHVRFFLAKRLTAL
jgi:GNAT superfamily N-acetyltransferase